MMNVKMIQTGSSIARRWNLKELDRGDAQRRLCELVSRMTWKV